MILRVNDRCLAVKQVTLSFLPKPWSKPLSTALEANTLTIAQSKWFDKINKTDVFPFYAVFIVVKLGDNCNVYENFTTSIGNLMVVNWLLAKRNFQIQYSYLHYNVIILYMLDVRCHIIDKILNSKNISCYFNRGIDTVNSTQLNQQLMPWNVQIQYSYLHSNIIMCIAKLLIRWRKR